MVGLEVDGELAGEGGELCTWVGGGCGGVVEVGYGLVYGVGSGGEDGDLGVEVAVGGEVCRRDGGVAWGGQGLVFSD